MALARQLVTGHVTSRLPPRALVACLLAAALLTHPAALASQSSYQDVEVGSEGSSDMAFIKKLAGLSFPFQTQNPFLFAVYHLDYYPEGKPGSLAINGDLRGRNIGADFGARGPGKWNMYHGDSVPGFPEHPHRGFETITLVRNGYVDHSDSKGFKGRYADGDTQWMTAGSGLSVHKDKPNTLDLFQIWLNLPPASKMVEPAFKMLWKEDTAFVTTTDDAGKTTKVQTVAGRLGPEHPEPVSPPPDSWASKPENKVAIWVITMEAGAKWTLPKTEEGVNRSLFFFTGDSITLGDAADGGKKITSEANIQLHPQYDVPITNSGGSKVELLLLQGHPIDAPVVQHGPFVMNSRAEIMEAFEDYHSGKMGSWPWSSSAPTHGELPRFALHAGGREEWPEGKPDGAKVEGVADAEAKEGAGAGAGSA